MREKEREGFKLKKVWTFPFFLDSNFWLYSSLLKLETSVFDGVQSTKNPNWKIQQQRPFLKSMARFLKMNQRACCAQFYEGTVFFAHLGTAEDAINVWIPE